MDPRIQVISDAIRVIPDFPKPGILFQDVTTILLNPDAFQHSIDIMAEHYKSQDVDVIAGASITLFCMTCSALRKCPVTSCRFCGMR